MEASVLLPAPFSPSSAWISPARSWKSTESLATTPAKALETFLASTSTVPAGTVLVATVVCALFSIGGAKHAFHEVVHLQQLLQRGHLSGRKDFLAVLILDRPGEGRKSTAFDVLAFGVDAVAHVLRHGIAIGCEARRVVLHIAVDRVGLPGTVANRLGHVD